ncbi:hypothetical protein ACFV4K_01045 [Nocardia sp. NPDC059764]|uniref:hypothetical protein n=1 Tax=Nocardia sp. NPDC059764 TaxID=3346939 RepID=UPI00364BF7C3
MTLATACGILAPQDGPARKQEPKDCSATFDFGPWTGDQPLGSSERLYQTILDARAKMQTISMLDIAHTAAWSDEWDRMVSVWENTDRAELNSRAQTPGYCWKNLPPSSVMSGRPSDGFYLFIRDNRPVQFVRYRISEDPILMVRGAVVTKETVLVYYGSKLKPQ